MKIPLIITSSLWHVGDLNNNIQGARPSLEGTLLSASACPNAWVGIARLGGGKYYELGHESMLLDMVKALYDVEYTGLREKIHQWASEEGLVKPGTMYVVAYEDDEDGRIREMHFHSEDEAREEAEPYDAEVVVRSAVLPTEKLMTIHNITKNCVCSSTGMEFSMVEWARVHLYSRRVTGVYWNETLDEAALSAPRAGLFSANGFSERQDLPDDEDCLSSVNTLHMEIYPRPAVRRVYDRSPSI